MSIAHRTQYNIYNYQSSLVQRTWLLQAGYLKTPFLAASSPLISVNSSFSTFSNDDTFKDQSSNVQFT
eukprot:c20518_g2_i1 orf=169-372(+)